MLVSVLRVPVGDGVDGELVVGPARVLDTVARPARLVPHLHLRVRRQILKIFFIEQQIFLWCVYRIKADPGSPPVLRNAAAVSRNNTAALGIQGTCQSINDEQYAMGNVIFTNGRVTNKTHLDSPQAR